MNEEKNFEVLLQSNWEDLQKFYKPTLWNKFINLIPWQFVHFFCSLKTLLEIIFNPRKFWHLNYFIRNVNSLADREEFMHRTLLFEEKDENSICKQHGYNHLLIFEEYKEILGPFYDGEH
jgi:hypothetical protein